MAFSYPSLSRLGPWRRAQPLGRGGEGGKPMKETLQNNLAKWDGLACQTPIGLLLG